MGTGFIAGRGSHLIITNDQVTQPVDGRPRTGIPVGATQTVPDMKVHTIKENVIANACCVSAENILKRSSCKIPLKCRHVRTQSRKIHLENLNFLHQFPGRRVCLLGNGIYRQKYDDQQKKQGRSTQSS